MLKPLIRPSFVRAAVFGGYVFALVYAGFIVSAHRGVAVTFDGDLRAGTTTTNTLSLGGQGEWDTVNGTIFLKPLFLGVGNVGIGASDPATRLEVNGGLRFSFTNGSTLRSTCSSAYRGMLWVEYISDGTDILEICVKNASDTYAWVAL